MKNYITNIRKKIPETIKRPIRYFYNMWSTKIDNDVLDFLQQYYKLSRKSVRYFLRNGGRLSADLWVCSNPKTQNEIKKYYEDNPFYAFHLIYWHGTKYQRDLRNRFVKLAKGSVLDYGGGIGDLCAKICRHGLKIDYADLQGRMFNFAQVFFKVNNLNIKMIELSNDNITDRYDTIFCIDTIEHVLNPKGVLKGLVEHLNNNGQLIITALETNISDDAPMHFAIDFNSEEYFNSLGMEKTNEEFVWIKK